MFPALSLDPQDLIRETAQAPVSSPMSTPQQVQLVPIPQQADSKDRAWKSIKYKDMMATASESGGAKYDALVRLAQVLDLVPQMFYITDAQIKSLFSENTIDLWDAVCKKGKAGLFHEKETACLLDRLHDSIVADITSSRLTLTQEQQKGLDTLKEKWRMVRSSSNEDSTKASGHSVNAGGNLSLGGIVTEAELLQASAEVAASPFRYQSLKNRLPDNPFDKMPSCSFFGMEQITGDRICSGVMMTHKPTWCPEVEGRIIHIAASWGFGGGVVSGKIPADQWIVTEGQTYESIRRKPRRLTVLAGGKTAEVENSPEMMRSPSLTDEQIYQLTLVAEIIEDVFKAHMDVEFVFRGEELFIVQVREIQAEEIDSPTFLDPASIPDTTLYFHSTPILGGESKVLSLEESAILFAGDLEEADRLFISSEHKAVIVQNAPRGGNSHPEVNFTSHKPPIPCLHLPPEEWEACRQFASGKKVTICPQTGLIPITDEELPVRQGLLRHPARLSLCIDTNSKGLAGPSKNPDIVRLNQLLTQTPEQIQTCLPEIGSSLEKIFSEIGSRPLNPFLLETANKVYSLALSIFLAMQKSAQKEHPFQLSLHASMLMHLLGQEESHHDRTFTIAGLETASAFPQILTSFMEKHHSSPVLCQLASFGQKAFSEDMLTRYLSYLEEKDTECEQLLETLTFLDSKGMVPTWFSIHFSQDQSVVNAFYTYATKLFLSQFQIFDDEFTDLSEMIERAASEKDVTACYETLEKCSTEFVKFASQHPPQNIMEGLKFTNVLIELIDTWDSMCKRVKTSKVFSTEEETALFHKYVTGMAKFGLTLIPFVRKDIAEPLQELLQRLILIYFAESQRSPFSVQQWLVPLSEAFGSYSKNHNIHMQNDDQRLSVIHQNLVQAANITDFAQLRPLLPSAVSKAVDLFFAHKAVGADYNRRKCTQIFVFFKENTIEVRINVPLVIHSLVVTFIQHKQCDKLEIDAYWRTHALSLDDNDFLPLFSAITGVEIKKHELIGTNTNSSFDNLSMNAVFAPKDERQVVLVCKAINQLNWASMVPHRFEFFPALISTLQDHPFNKDDPPEMFKQTRMLIFDTVWKRFEETGEFPQFLKYWTSPSPIVEYLSEKGLIGGIAARVADEFVGRVPRTVYASLFLTETIDLMPPEDRETIYCNFFLDKEDQNVRSYRTNMNIVEKKFQAETDGVQKNVFKSIWKSITQTGTVSDCFKIMSNNNLEIQQKLAEFLSEQGLFEQLTQQVIDELSDKRPRTDLVKVFLHIALKPLSNDVLERVLLANLLGPDPLSPDQIRRFNCDGIFQKFVEKDRAKATAYMQDHRHAYELYSLLPEGRKPSLSDKGPSSLFIDYYFIRRPQRRPPMFSTLDLSTKLKNAHAALHTSPKSEETGGSATMDSSQDKEKLVQMLKAMVIETGQESSSLLKDFEEMIAESKKGSTQ